MLGFVGSEGLFYGGIAVMAAVGILTVLSLIIFTITGRRIKKELKQEYGEIKR